MQMEADRRIRALYRLAERSEGADLERVRAAIAARRRMLEAEARSPSAWDALPAEEDEPWRPGARPFRPASADAVPVGHRRPGERGYRIVGTRATHGEQPTATPP
ncbi:MAG: hypothetical protein JWM73_3033 [Solirubrobacterales bacterium]|nr:hypothetical protein [Solirubrobacterales bacterium]